MEVAGPLRRRAPERRHRAARDRLRAGADHPRRRRPSPSEVAKARREPLPRPDGAARASSAGRTFRRNLAPCDAVTHPAQFSGLDVLAILTIDLDRGMYSLDRDGVMAGAQVVYGSDRQPLRRQPPLRARARARRRRARGHADRDPPLRHLRPDEDRLPRDRHGPGLHPQQLRALRVQRRPARGLDRGAAVDPGGTGAEPEPRDRARARTARGSSGSASVERARPGRAHLRRALHGRAAATSSRSARSTRCTRSTCRDPTAPKVVGELKIPGYSAYLHPVGEDRLLGVGREGAERPGVAVRRLQHGGAAARSRSCSSAPARRRSSPSRTRSCTGRRRTSP